MSGLRVGLGAAVAAAVATAAVVGCSWFGRTGGGESHRGSELTAARFDHPRPNAYFPTRPGTTFHYRRTDEGGEFRETVAVTHRTKTVQGVQTRVFRDVLRRADGSLAEKTWDWYANDNHGNVWYFGENTATYDRNGRLNSREGSWQAGVKGARMGVIMPASPRPAKAYRQEYRRGQAEDQAWIVESHEQMTVPFGHVGNVVRTYEWSRLEPGVVSAKLYAPKLGIVKEWDVAGGSERFVLVSVSHR